MGKRGQTHCDNNKFVNMPLSVIFTGSIKTWQFIKVFFYGNFDIIRVRLEWHLRKLDCARLEYLRLKWFKISGQFYFREYISITGTIKWKPTIIPMLTNQSSVRSFFVKIAVAELREKYKNHRIFYFGLAKFRLVMICRRFQVKHSSIESNKIIF